MVCEDEETGVAELAGRRLFSGSISHQRSQRRSTAVRLSTEVRAAESTGESSHIYVHEIECEIVLDLFDFGMGQG